MRTARWRAEVNKHMGVNSEVIDADEVRRICPVMNVTDDVRYPILGALYHPPGAIARHDAVAWGYAKEAHASRRRGAHADGREKHPGRERPRHRRRDQPRHHPCRQNSAGGCGLIERRRQDGGA